MFFYTGKNEQGTQGYLTDALFTGESHDTDCNDRTGVGEWRKNWILGGC